MGIQDAVKAYTRAIEANQSISGVFNVASGNYTVGEIGDIVTEAVKELMDMDIKLTIKDIKDFRNYKVSIEKAMNVLSFKPKQDVRQIVEELVRNFDKFQDLNDPNYYNIQIFKTLSQKVEKLQKQ